MSLFEDYIKLLELQPNFNLSELRKAYREKVFQYHPDKAKNEAERIGYEALMKKLNEANEYLKEYLENSEKANQESFNKNDEANEQDDVNENDYSFNEEENKKEYNYNNAYYYRQNSYNQTNFSKKFSSKIIDTEYIESNPKVFFIVITIMIFTIALFPDMNKNTPSNSIKTSNTQNKISYPSCNDNTTLKPMKKERTEQLKPILEESPYVLNANYSLWYKNTSSKGNGYCATDEMIKNLFWEDPNIYLVHHIDYRASYKNGNVVTEHDNFYDTNFDKIISNSIFYNENRKLSESEINTLLNNSLPQNYKNNETKNNSYPITKKNSLNEQYDVYNYNLAEQSSNTSSNYQEPDFGSYMKDLQKKIKMNWEPPKVNQSKRVVLIFTVAKDGKLLNVKVKDSSGTPDCDNAAIQAVKMTAPFNPLPETFKGNSVDIQFSFDYNVK